MATHDWWHLVVLGSTLFGAAALALLVVVPLAFDEPPPGLKRWRPLLWWLMGFSVALLAVEWLGLH